MRLNEAFPSNWLKCDDLQGRQVKVIIEKYSFEEIGEERKLVLHFQGKEKGLVCNKTNAGSIAQICQSEEMDDWCGQAIILFPTTTPFNGKPTACIRVLPPPQVQSGKSAPAGRTAPKKATTAPASEEPTDDDSNIPF